MQSDLPHTRALLGAHVPRDLVGCAMRYLQTPNRDWLCVAICGEYETCLHGCPKPSAGLLGACQGGHLALAKLMIAAKGATNLESALRTACKYGHLAIANLLIANGATECGAGLYGACEGGQLALANAMIAKGANNWNVALWWACCGGKPALAKMMAANGATHCVICNTRAHWQA